MIPTKNTYKKVITNTLGLNKLLLKKYPTLSLTELKLCALLTAFALTGDRGKALNAGCNDYISKPIKKDTLMEKIQKYF